MLFYTALDGLSDEEVTILIGQAVRKKKAVLGGHKGGPEGLAATINRPMILIGG